MRITHHRRRMFPLLHGNSRDSIDIWRHAHEGADVTVAVWKIIAINYITERGMAVPELRRLRLTHCEKIKVGNIVY